MIRIILSLTMMHSTDFPLFRKDLEKLSRKHPTLWEDFHKFCQVLSTWDKERFPVANWPKTDPVSSGGKGCHYLKTRMRVRGTRKTSFRVVYAYYPRGDIKFRFIELFFKGDQVNASLERIAEYEKYIFELED